MSSLRVRRKTEAASQTNGGQTIREMAVRRHSESQTDETVRGQGSYRNGLTERRDRHTKTKTGPVGRDGRAGGRGIRPLERFAASEALCGPGAASFSTWVGHGAVWNVYPAPVVER